MMTIAFLTIAFAFHHLGAVVWVGGMFGAYVCLRPAARELEAPQRLRLWRQYLQKFFPWMWASVLAQLLSGYWLLFTMYGSFAAAPLYINLMQAIGWVKIALFAWMFFVPWREFNYDIEAQNLSAAIANIKRIEKIVLASLLLGIIALAINSTGAYW